MSPPAWMISRMKPGNGLAGNVRPDVRSAIVPEARSTSTSSPAAMAAAASGHSRIGRPDVDGVPVENPGEARRDDAAHAAGLDRQRRVLAGRPAAEVPAGDDQVAGPDRGRELRVDILHAVAGQFRRIVSVEIACRDDDVRVDVVSEFVDFSFDVHASAFRVKYRSALDGFGSGDSARDGRRGGDRRTGQVDEGFRMSHPADEIPVGGGQSPFALGQDAHVAAEARAAGRRPDDRAGLEERPEEAFIEGLTVDRRRPGRTIRRSPRDAFFPFRIRAAILKSSIRPFVQEPMTTWSRRMSPTSSAGLTFDGRCGKRHHGPEAAEVDRPGLLVNGVRVGLDDDAGRGAVVAGVFERAARSAGKMPFFAPPSMAMLAMVNRASMESEASPGPPNSMDW